jgi:hypothetical protein
LKPVKHVFFNVSEKKMVFKPSKNLPRVVKSIVNDFRPSASNNYVDLDEYLGSGSCAYIVLNPRTLPNPVWQSPNKRFRGSVNSINNDGFRGGTPNSSIDLEWEVDGNCFSRRKINR